MLTDPTQRFTDRVDDYARYRPGYPSELITFLHRTCGVAPDACVADIGAGTGISSKLLLDAGHPVVAVEPNAAMRQAADRELSHYPGYRSVAASAEQTTLPAASIDLITAAQAFHWFDLDATRQEFCRILRPGGGVALFWNLRAVDESPLLRDYENLLHTYGTDYAQVAERYPGDGDKIARWFNGGLLHSGCFANRQTLDYAALRGRLLSSSYVPKAGHHNHQPMLDALKILFNKYAECSVVQFNYQTHVYYGRFD